MKKQLVLIIFLAMILISCTGCHNMQLVGMTCHYDQAIIYLPNGEIVEGRVNSWTSCTSFGGAGAVEIKIDGKTYLTHICNVCLIDD